VPPDDKTPDHVVFNRYGVRVPAVIVSPYVPKGSIIRPPGATPFDHTSISATLRALYGITPLTARDAAAPDLTGALDTQPDNDGPERIVAPAPPPAAQEADRVAAKPPNDMQKSLSHAAVLLPTLGANVSAHIARLGSIAPVLPDHPSVAHAAGEVAAHVKAFLGLS
jgi:phospholipase C